MAVEVLSLSSPAFRQQCAACALGQTETEEETTHHKYVFGTPWVPIAAVALGIAFLWFGRGIVLDSEGKW